MMNRRIFLATVGWFAILLWVSITPYPSSAQSALKWSSPQRIRGISNDSDAPYLVVDRNRTVHAFNSQWTGGELAVFYSEWSPGRIWTMPNDVLLSPYSHQATVLGAFLDQKGIMHVAIFGGTDQGAGIYYSKATAVNASQANAWEPLKLVGSHAGPLTSGTLTGDNAGNLFIVYSGNLDGNGLYEVHSTDEGNTWSEPSNVFLTDSGSRWAFAIRTVLDSAGQLHAVWTVKNKQGTGDAVYYARLQSDYKRWSIPVTLQETKGGDYQADWSSIIWYNEELMVVYDYGIPPRLWMRRSSNGGKVWTDPAVILDPLVGETGHSLFLVDSSNNLHFITVKRTNDNRIGGIWHSQWAGSQWGVPEPVATGPASSTQFAPSRPTGVIIQGNLLLVTWRQDPGLSGNGIWYTYATLNAPELPLHALPTAIASTPSPPPTTSSRPLGLSPVGLPQPPPTRVDDGTPVPVSQNDPGIGIMLAVLPVVLILMVVVVTRNRR